MGRSLSSPSNGNDCKHYNGSSYNGDNYRSSSSSSSWATTSSSYRFLPSTTRGTILLTAFVVIIVQIHLIFDRTYHASQAMNPCHDAAILDAPFVVIPNATLAQARFMTKDKNPLSSSGNSFATSQRQQQQQQQQRQQSQQGLHAPYSKELPEINENGMIIFFLHIPKTGGTTMSHPFEHNPIWRHRMVYGWNKEAKFREEMYATLKDWKPGMRIFYEYHGGRASPYMNMQVREDLLTWRAMAQVRNIPFFAFTIVREPLSMAVSFFNYYYAHRKNGDDRYFYVPDPTVKDFVELSLPSPQCLFCVHSEIAYYQGYRKAGHPVDVGKEGCARVYEAFVNDFDWVGTTEAMTDETFKLVGQVANVHFMKEIVKNKSKDKISRANLTDAAIAHVRNITRDGDQMFHDNARRDFPITMWKNFDPTLKLPRPETHPRLFMRDHEQQHITEITDPRYKRKGFKERMKQNLETEVNATIIGDTNALSKRQSQEYEQLDESTKDQDIEQA